MSTLAPTASTYNINLTYTSPTDDMESCMGINPDETINVSYTLIAMRNLLTENIERLNNLIEISSAITDLNINDADLITITLNDQDIIKYLKESSVIQVKQENNDVTNDDDDPMVASVRGEEEEDFQSDNEETHNDRLKKIQNMVKLNQPFNTPGDIESNSQSHSQSNSSDDDVTDDIISIQDLITKYDKLQYDCDSDHEKSE